MRRTGWVLDSSTRRILPLPWDRLSSVGLIRYAGMAQTLARQSNYSVERFLPWKNYDAVLFVKRMGADVERLVKKLKQRGTKVIFDANVNYYETWGNFPVPGTCPSPEQQESASRITRLADAVIADSSYLAGQCKKLNLQTTWIPDGVDTEFFKPRQIGKKPGPLTFIWSGMGKKAHHLKLLMRVLPTFRKRIRLILIASQPSKNDVPAPELEQLRQSMDAEIRYWDYTSYRDWLMEADVIISPKDLSAAYEMAHTEYKISLGMAMGLPALASPQPSYLDAIGDGQGGRICHSEEDWSNAIERYLCEPEQLTIEGTQARKRVLERYALPVVARQLQVLLDSLL